MLFEKRRHLRKQHYLSGLLTGLVAGMAVGFLFAPRSGKDLRKKVVGIVNDQTKEALQQWDRTKAQAKGIVETVKTNSGFDFIASKAKKGD